MHVTHSLMYALAQTAPSGQPTPADDTQWVVYAIVAFGCALALLVLEAFVPSGGVLGTIAAACAIGGIVMFFQFDTTWGMVSMAVTLLATPFVLAGMLWVWPNTPIGRALTLANDPPEQAEAPREPEPGAIAVGVEGEALTELRPIGACRLNGKRVDCIAQTGLIKRGTKVRVVYVDAMAVKVKPV